MISKRQFRLPHIAVTRKELFLFVAIFLILFAMTYPNTLNNRSVNLWDDFQYIAMANSFVHGRGLTIPFTQGATDYAGVWPSLWHQNNMIAQPLTSDGPVFPLFLSSVFLSTGADPTDWFVIGALANMVLVFFMIMLSYKLSKNLFSSEVAIVTAIILLFWVGSYSMSSRVVREPLLWLITLSAFYIAIQVKTDSPVKWLGLGIISGLAHLVNASGFFCVASIFLWLVIGKKFKNSLVVLTGYVLMIMPWILRNQLTLSLMYGKWSWGIGLGLPIIQIYSVAGSLISGGAIRGLSLINPLAIMQSSITYLIFVDSMLAVLFILIFVPIGYIKNSKRRNLNLFLVATAVVLVSFYGEANIMNRINMETRFLYVALIVLIPMGISGLFKCLDRINTRFLAISIRTIKWRWRINWKAIFAVALISVSIIGLMNFQSVIAERMLKPSTINPIIMNAHMQLKEMVPSNLIVLSWFPPVTYYLTAMQSLNFPPPCNFNDQFMKQYNVSLIFGPTDGPWYKEPYYYLDKLFAGQYPCFTGFSDNTNSSLRGWNKININSLNGSLYSVFILKEYPIDNLVKFDFTDQDYRNEQIDSSANISIKYLSLSFDALKNLANFNISCVELNEKTNATITVTLKDQNNSTLANTISYHSSGEEFARLSLPNENVGGIDLSKIREISLQMITIQPDTAKIVSLSFISVLTSE